MLRGIIVFLIGFGFAAGAFLTGMAPQHLPGFIGSLGHIGFADSAQMPVVVHVASSAEETGCPPTYRLINRTGNAVFFALPRDVGGGPADVVSVPPGASLMPGIGRGAAYQRQDIPPPDGDGLESASAGRPPGVGGCDPPVVKIELAER